MSDSNPGCAKPAGGPVVPAAEAVESTEEKTLIQEVKMLAKVGKEAIDFTANAFIEGKGFKPVKLSDYKGKWIVLCFYPGDFTFV